MPELSAKRFIATTRVITSFGFYLTIPLLAVVALRAGSMTVAEVGILLAAQALFRRGMAIPSGILCDRYGGAKLLVAGLAAEAVGYVLLSSSITFSIWLIAVVVDGVGGAVYNTASRVVLAEASDDAAASSLAGFYVATNVGALLGPLIAALVADHSARIVLAMSALAYVVSAISAYRRFGRHAETRAATGKSIWHSTRQAIRDPKFLVYCSLTIPLWYGISLLVSALPLEANAKHLGYFDVGLINSLNAAMVVAFGTMGGRWVDKLDHKQRLRLLGAGSAIMAAGCLVCLAPGRWSLYAGILVITVGELINICASEAVAVRFAPKGATGVYLGFITTAWSVAGVAVSLLAGALLGGDPASRTLFWVFSAGLLVVGAVALALFSRVPVNQPVPVAD
ncbi:MFS transporter [Amycolatopsis sp. NPDC059657]|uniref:MFS transporter n=1 Tax=Amycolatopsis sp. NPDC059657 TaxID=3346899 RepID=UPI00366C5833